MKISPLGQSLYVSMVHWLSLLLLENKEKSIHLCLQWGKGFIIDITTELTSNDPRDFQLDVINCPQSLSLGKQLQGLKKKSITEWSVM